MTSEVSYYSTAYEDEKNNYIIEIYNKRIVIEDDEEGLALHIQYSSNIM